jgi:hypothetical protein
MRDGMARRSDAKERATESLEEGEGEAWGEGVVVGGRKGASAGGAGTGRGEGDDV